MENPSDLTNDGVVVLIRFDSNYAYSYNNALKRQSSAMQSSYGGKEFCFCPQLHYSSGNKVSKTHGLGMVQFPNEEKAMEWLHSAPRINQHDWLFGVDMLLCPLRAPLSSDARFLEVIDWQTIRDTQAFYSEYLEMNLPPADPSLSSFHDGCNLIASPDYVMKCLRGSWHPVYLVVNQWKSVEAIVKHSFVHSDRMIHFKHTVAVFSSTIAGMSDAFLN